MTPKRIIVLCVVMTIIVGSLTWLSVEKVYRSHMAQELNSMNFNRQHGLLQTKIRHASLEIVRGIMANRLKPFTTGIFNGSNSGSNSNGFKIPNIVHYVWCTNKIVPFEFYMMLSIMSAHQILKPDIIYFHTNKEPRGVYWEQIKDKVTVQRKRKDPTKWLPNNKRKHSDNADCHVYGMMILKHYGGIYLDLDVFVIKSMDTLRSNYDCVLGWEKGTEISAGVILSNKKSKFLDISLTTVFDNINKWVYNTNKMLSNLAEKHHTLLHIEPIRFHSPNYEHLDKLLKPQHPVMNWGDHYTLHLWKTHWRHQEEFRSVVITPQSIKSMDNLVGEVARMIYFGHNKNKSENRIIPEGKYMNIRDTKKGLDKERKINIPKGTEKSKDAPDSNRPKDTKKSKDAPDSNRPKDTKKSKDGPDRNRPKDTEKSKDGPDRNIPKDTEKSKDGQNNNRPTKTERSTDGQNKKRTTDTEIFTDGHNKNRHTDRETSTYEQNKNRPIDKANKSTNELKSNIPKDKQ